MNLRLLRVGIRIKDCFREAEKVSATTERAARLPIKSRVQTGLLFLGVELAVVLRLRLVTVQRPLVRIPVDDFDPGWVSARVQGFPLLAPRPRQALRHAAKSGASSGSKSEGNRTRRRPVLESPACGIATR